MDRRKFLSSAIGASIVSASGCCTSARPISESESFRPAGTPLSPYRVNDANRISSKVIDPHCHIFNATDLQIAGYLRGPIAYQLPKSLRWIAIGLASPIEWVMKRVAISAHEEMENLRTLSAKGALGDLNALSGEIRQHREKVADLLMTRLYKTGYATQMDAELQNQYAVNKSGSTKFDEEFLLRSFESGSNADDAEDALKIYRARGVNIDGILAFAGFLLSPRMHNFREYQRGYTTSDGAFGINRCYASMVDFDYWIGDCDHTRSRLRDQIILMENLAELSGGHMRPLVAYNPWTDIEDGDESINLVKDAIGARGFAGVKIYPPMGFFPHGNATNPSYPTNGKHPDLGLIDKKLQALFTYCRDKDVPVMSHSNESMGRLPSHDILGGPSGWGTFFGEKESAGSRVNLGHVGGSKNKDGGTGNWTRQFTDLMNTPNAKHLYGDLGFWDDVIEDKPEAVKRLTDLLDTKLMHGDTVADRLMFGTDWFMLAQTGTWSSYAIKFQQALSRAGVPRETVDKLFYQNAERLFGEKVEKSV